jgi:hypothetical protein
MQAEFDTTATLRPVSIVGVNGIGLESGNAETVDGRVIPWLQDTGTAKVWESWAVTYRDVVILDAANVKLSAFNLTAHNLADPVEYAALRQILLDAANAP